MKAPIAPSGILTDLIPTETILDNKLIEQWNSVIPLLEKQYVTGVTTIKGDMGYKYKGDLYGLFLELGINRELIYPYIKVNGYDSSDEYDGKLTQLKVLDSGMLSIIYNMFVNN